MTESYTPREFIDKINAENPGPVFDPYGVEGLVTVQDQEPSVAKDLIAKAQEDAKLQPNLDMDVLISQLKDIDAKIEMVSQPSELERLLKEKNELVSQFFRDRKVFIELDLQKRSTAAEALVNKNTKDSKVLNDVKTYLKTHGAGAAIRHIMMYASSHKAQDLMRQVLDIFILDDAKNLLKTHGTGAAIRHIQQYASSPEANHLMHQALDGLIFKATNKLIQTHGAGSARRHIMQHATDETKPKMIQVLQI